MKGSNGSFYLRTHKDSPVPVPLGTQQTEAWKQAEVAALREHTAEMPARERQNFLVTYWGWSTFEQERLVAEYAGTGMPDEIMLARVADQRISDRRKVYAYLRDRQTNRLYPVPAAAPISLAFAM